MTSHSSAALLTLAIPTLNRAQRLDQQLTALYEQAHPYFPEVTFLVSDNASEDQTPQVCQRWQEKIGSEHFRVIRQQQTINLQANLTALVETAQSHYLWVIGDDDPIFSDSLAEILTHLREGHAQDLTYLHLDHQIYNVAQKAEVAPKLYPQWQQDQYFDNGAQLYRQIMATKGFTGIMFITANILHTATAQEAIRHWPEGRYNDAFNIYFTGRVAQAGKARYLARPMLRCEIGASSWASKYEKVYKVEVPQALLQLHRQGYYRPFLKHYLRGHLLRPGLVKVALRNPRLIPALLTILPRLI